MSTDTDAAAIFLAPGQNDVSVPNMTSFSHVGGFVQSVFTESLAAHTLGNIGSSYNYSELVALSGQPYASNPAAFWDAGDHWEYVYLDAEPNVLASTSILNPVAVYSDRRVLSSALCKTPRFSWDMIDGLATIRNSETGKDAIFPAVALGIESVTYLTERLNPDSRAFAKLTGGSCGEGCSAVFAVEPHGGRPAAGTLIGNDTAPFYYYECNITVSSTHPDFPGALPPRQAAIAAQAVALTGQIDPRNDSLHTEWAGYTFGAPFGEPQNNSAVGMAAQVSRFAIGTVSAAAQTNPNPLNVTGRQPQQGSRLALEQPLAFYIILALVAMLQLALLGAAAVLLGRVDVPVDVRRVDDDMKWNRFVGR